MNSAGTFAKSATYPFGPGGLWSQWDMLELNGRAFYSAIATMHRIWGVVRDDDRKKVIEEKNRKKTVALLERFADQLRVLGAEMTLLSVDRLIATMSKEGVTFGTYEDGVEDIDRRLRDQLSLRKMFVLDDTEAGYFAPKEPLFGADVASKFPGATYEVDEAAKCFALSRPTASTFHAIRCLEAGIRALSRCLQIPDPTRAGDRNWGAMLRELKAAIDAKWPGSSTRLSGDGEFFDNAYAALAAIQNPWRNATMHLDQKYTDDEARHIFDLVKGFMLKLASRMDENGLPLA